MKFVRGEPVRACPYEKNLKWFDKLFVGTYDRDDGFNQNMFSEDFLNIFLHSNSGSGNLFGIDTNNDKLTDRLLHNVKTPYGLGSKDETIAELIEEIARSLIWIGKAFYYLHDDNKKDETNIASCSSKSIFRFAGNVVQYLPSGAQKNGDREDVTTGRELRLLDAQKILCFRWPTSVHRKITTQNKVLATLDKYNSSIALKFLPPVTYDNPNPRNYFDFKKWKTTHDLALYKATQQTGWNARKYDSSKKSDFFDCHRLIRFRRIQLGFRDHILNQLSKQLSRAGRCYWPNFEIDISTTNILPSIAHLDDLEARLFREEAGFSEVIDYCLKS